MTKTKLKKQPVLNINQELGEVWETLAEISVAVEDELEPTVEELEVAMEKAQQDIQRLEALVGKLQEHVNYWSASASASVTTSSQAAPSYSTSCNCCAKKSWCKRWLGR